MDPTKSFDHLDPKLKETYARVMGTDSNGANTTTPPSQQPPDQGMAATPNTFDPPQPVMDPNQNQLGTAPLDPSLGQIPNGDVPNPGTGPTISTMPSTDTSSMFSAAPLDNPAPAASAPDPNASPNSAFFSNPSPAISDPTQTPNDSTAVAPPVEPIAETGPVTPYTPEGMDASQSTVPQYTQPLPSPSSVNQAATHETSPLLKVLYIIGAVVFFAIYTIFWIKVFNLPFLF